MRRTVIAAALLAGFAMPSFAEDATTKTTDGVPSDASLQAATSQEKASKPVYAKDRSSDCMKRHSSAMNMM